MYNPASKHVLDSVFERTVFCSNSHTSRVYMRAPRIAKILTVNFQGSVLRIALLNIIQEVNDRAAIDTK